MYGCQAHGRPKNLSQPFVKKMKSRPVLATSPSGPPIFGRVSAQHLGNNHQSKPPEGKKGTGHGRHKHRRRHTRAHGRTEAQAHGHTTKRDSATAPRPTWSRTRQRRTLTPIHVQVHHIPHHARLRHNSGEDNTLRRTRDPIEAPNAWVESTRRRAPKQTT